MFVPSYPRRRATDGRSLWDQPVLPALQGGGALTIVAPTDPGCSGRPTILKPAFDWTAADFDHYPGTSCYPWEQDPPLWAGYARGLFRFNARVVPARTHGGLASQAAIEARLGRSIPDPTNPEGEVFYWHEYPLVFRIRNNSGGSVTALFTRLGGCGQFQQAVPDGWEMDIGPLWGDPSHVLVQIIGPSAAPGGAPTVPSGVDVRVVELQLADPGETFALRECQDPNVLLFDETFEGVGYVETWDSGETVTGGAALDEDAASPGGAPSWWGSKALRVTVAAGERAFVRHQDLGIANPVSRTTFGLYIDSEGLADTDAVYVALLKNASSVGIVQFYVAQEGGQLSFRAAIHHDDADHVYSVDIGVQEYHRVEFRWDQTAEEFEYLLDDVSIASGAITATPASADWEVQEVLLGVSNAADAAIDYYVGRLTLSTSQANYLL